MIDNNIKIELEKIKQLLDTKVISESEYIVLKEEILFKRNSKKEDLNIKPKFESSKESDTKAYHHNNEKSSNNTYTYLFIFCFIIGFLVWNSNDNSDETQSESDIISTENSSVETDSYVSTTICKICGNEFSGDGYDKIDGIYQRNTNIQTELCSSSCARIEEKNIEDKYDKILEKNGYKSSKYFSIDNDDRLKVGKDGRLYESKPCSLCNGTGIESGRNIMTGEVEGRICPMCDGRGVRSY
jgi:hypothetical protein